MSAAGPPTLSGAAPLLEVLAHRPSGLLSDLDGTLCPIAPRPEQARVPSDVRPVLARLAGHLDLVAIISGRSAADLRELVGVSHLAYIGNHGLEQLQGDTVRLDPVAAPFLPVMERVKRALALALRMPGVIVESKGISLSVHYRLAPDPAAARAAILDTLQRLPEAARLRLKEGRMVINVLPPGGPDKRAAVLALAGERALRGVVYLGDDSTDVDAFQALRELRARGVATAAVAVVSHEAPPRLLELADYRVEDVGEVGLRLAELAESVSRGLSTPRLRLQTP